MSIIFESFLFIFINILPFNAFIILCKSFILCSLTSCSIVYFVLNNDMAENFQINFQEPATTAMNILMDLHNDIFFFLITILFFVISFWNIIIKSFSLFEDFYKINSQKKDSFFSLIQRPGTLVYNEALEIIWTIIPCVILLLIAMPSLTFLFVLESTVYRPWISFRIIGNQWYWSYEFTYSNGFVAEFDSVLVNEEDLGVLTGFSDLNPFRLLRTDTYMSIPKDTPMRFLITSNDVLHSWAIPSFGIKMDACPGRLNEVFTLINDKTSNLHLGQCSEICGINHAFMPIMARTLTKGNFLLYTIEQFYSQMGLENTESPWQQTSGKDYILPTEIDIEKKDNLLHFTRLNKRGDINFMYTLFFANYFAWIMGEVFNCDNYHTGVFTFKNIGGYTADAWDTLLQANDNVAKSNNWLVKLFNTFVPKWFNNELEAGSIINNNTLDAPLANIFKIYYGLRNSYTKFWGACFDNYEEKYEIHTLPIDILELDLKKIEPILRKHWREFIKPNQVYLYNNSSLSDPATIQTLDNACPGLHAQLVLCTFESEDLFWKTINDTFTFSNNKGYTRESLMDIGSIHGFRFFPELLLNLLHFYIKAHMGGEGYMQRWNALEWETALFGGDGLPVTVHDLITDYQTTTEESDAWRVLNCQKKNKECTTGLCPVDY